MKLGFSFFVFIFFLQLGYSQDWKLVDSISIESRDSITDFDTDDFNNLYYIRNFSELNKLYFDTRTKKAFSNQSILENLDAQNVLQITLRSGLFNLLVLDNQLNQVQDLIKFPIETNFAPTLTALVDNNYLWGYDPVLQRLVLWNYQENRVLRQSVILSEKTSDEYYPMMIYRDNKIYLVGYKKVLIFDEYANLELVIPFQKFDQLYLKKGTFYFSNEAKLYKMNLKTKVINEIPIEHSFDYFSINTRYLFVLKNKVVYLYASQKN